MTPCHCSPLGCVSRLPDGACALSPAEHERAAELRAANALDAQRCNCDDPEDETYCPALRAEGEALEREFNQRYVVTEKGRAAMATGLPHWPLITLTACVLFVIGVLWWWGLA